MLRVVMAAVEGNVVLTFFCLRGLTDLILQSESFSPVFSSFIPKSSPLSFFSPTDAKIRPFGLILQHGPSNESAAVGPHLVAPSLFPWDIELSILFFLAFGSFSRLAYTSTFFFLSLALSITLTHELLFPSPFFLYISIPPGPALSNLFAAKICTTPIQKLFQYDHQQKREHVSLNYPLCFQFTSSLTLN